MGGERVNLPLCACFVWCRQSCAIYLFYYLHDSTFNEFMELCVNCDSVGRLMHCYSIRHGALRHLIVFVFTVDFIILCIALYFSFFTFLLGTVQCCYSLTVLPGLILWMLFQVAVKLLYLPKANEDFLIDWLIDRPTDRPTDLFFVCLFVGWLVGWFVRSFLHSFIHSLMYVLQTRMNSYVFVFVYLVN